MNFHKVRLLRPYLTVQAKKVLLLSLVMSHLVYSNSILYGIASNELNKMQRIQNMCAKLVLNRKKYDSPFLAMKELHWLPVTSRIKFKI